MNICFFSDEYSTNFKPLTLTRPLDDLRIGIFTIREKWIKVLKPDHWARQVDDYLSQLFPTGKIVETSDYIWINSRFLPNSELNISIQSLKPGHALTKNGQLIASRVTAEDSNSLLESKKLPTGSIETEVDFEPIALENVWDLLSHNTLQIAFDIKLLPASFEKATKFDPSVILRNTDEIYIHESATVEPGCIIIAEDGPVYIGENTRIEAGSIIKGPSAICHKAEIKMGAKIFKGTTIGPVCKVGGEINNCIFHSYSNKAHDGFAGNSVIGEWSNFGAATNISNLKNNFSKVRLPNWDTGEMSDKGVQFMGAVFADFSKTAINTSLNTGTVCGVSSNIFCTGFPPKVIPSFTWLGDDTQVYEFDKAVEAMRAMMQRRGVELSQEYINMMRFIFNLEYSAGS